MKCDYDQLGFNFVSQILNENSLRLSRTRKGVSDTSTNACKRPLLLSGDALKQHSAENEIRVHRLLMEFRKQPEPAGPSAVKTWLFSIADLTNDKLLPAGRFREWPIRGKLSPEAIPGALEDLCARVYARWHDLEIDPVPLAAWSEWQLNGGPIHPFYDGCGRIARSFGALLLIRASFLLPLYYTSESYFEHGNKGDAEFCEYYRARIQDCARLRFKN